MVREAFTHIRIDHTVAQIAIVENNTTYGNPYCSSRNSYLGVSAVPVKKVDVTYSALGGGGTWNTHYAWIDQYLHQDLLVSAPGNIALSYSLSGGVITMTAVLTLDAALTGGSYRMWMVFTENDPNAADNAPHYYVRTGRAGTNSDMLVTISSIGQQQTFVWTFKWRSAWNQSFNHYGVAFLEQDFGSKTVVQAKQITMTAGLNGLTTVEPASLGQVRSLYH